MTKLLDRLIYGVIARRMDDGAIASYAQAVEKQESLGVSAAFQTIDAKATGLLTHVSMMIAGLGLVAPLVADSDFEIGMIIAEISAYLLIAVGCLRCLSVFSGQDLLDGSANIERTLARELIIRRELYALCNRASIILTIVVFFLLPFQFLWHPGK